MTEVQGEGVCAAMRKIAAYCIDLDLRMTAAIEYFEKAWLLERLERTGNNRCAVADIEGMHRNTVSRHLDALGVPRGIPGGGGVKKRFAKQA